MFRVSAAGETETEYDHLFPVAAVLLCDEILTQAYQILINTVSVALDFSSLLLLRTFCTPLEQRRRFQHRLA